MKRVFALILACLMCAAFAGCNSAPKYAFGENVTVKVMLMTQGDMNASTVSKVTDAVNARIAELNFNFKVEFSWSGVPWAFENLETALQTGSAPDIIPAHTWSGVTYPVGAQTGQYVRLDDPKSNLLDQFGKDIYAKTSKAIKDSAVIPGDQGTGIYAYIIEKDSVSQLGYLVNKTELEALGFSVSDFKADDLASWEPLLKKYKETYPGKYPLNIEAEVLDRTVNHVAYIGATVGPLGVVFDNGNPANTKIEVSSRYETEGYKTFINTMRGYYQAGYVDPDQGVAGEVSSTSVANRRTDGDFLIATFVYAPGSENVVAASASAAQGKTVEIVWAPGWKTSIANAETALGSGLAVYAGSKCIPEAVTFLNMLASDTVIGNLLGEGVEGDCYTVTNNTDILDEEGNPTGRKYADGILLRVPGRGGWNIWRYGVIGPASAATPLADLGADGQEWEDFKSFNGNAVSVSTGMFDSEPVDAKNQACIATIDKYAIALGSGAADPAQYDAFIAELKADGIDDVVKEAQKQAEAVLGK